MKTAEEVFNDKLTKGETSTPHKLEVISAMQDYARQVAEAVRKECAEKARLHHKYGDREDDLYMEYWRKSDEYGTKRSFAVNTDSILNVDIEQFLK